MTNGPRNSPSPLSNLSPQPRQFLLTLNGLPRSKSVRCPQLGQRHVIPLARIWARVTFIGRNLGGRAETTIPCVRNIPRGRIAALPRVRRAGAPGPRAGGIGSCRTANGNCIRDRRRGPHLRPIPRNQTAHETVPRRTTHLPPVGRSRMPRHRGVHAGRPPRDRTPRLDVGAGSGVRAHQLRERGAAMRSEERRSAGAGCRATEGSTQAGPPATEPRDWTWVQGAVFVPTNCVNEAQQWDEYDPAVNDRELRYASAYGINMVRVYLHYYVYLKKRDSLLASIEDFLGRADKYGIKTEFVFFDDCWNEPPAELLSPDYRYPAPIRGVHNSRWLVCPGDEVLNRYEQHRPRLKAYVQDIVVAHRADPRVAFWEIYNEPKKADPTVRLERDAFAWIKETGTRIPVTATGREFSGGPFSDFPSWHEYGDYVVYGGSTTLCTECMNRKSQTVAGVVEHFKGRVGYIMWRDRSGSLGERLRHVRPQQPHDPRLARQPEFRLGAPDKVVQVNSLSCQRAIDGEVPLEHRIASGLRRREQGRRVDFAERRRGLDAVWELGGRVEGD